MYLQVTLGWFQQIIDLLVMYLQQLEKQIIYVISDFSSRNHFQDTENNQITAHLEERATALVALLLRRTLSHLHMEGATSSQQDHSQFTKKKDG